MYLYNQESLEFMQWIRLIIFTIMGVVLILSAIVYVFNAELAWKWLIGGLGLLPILLLLQLFIFLMTIIRMVINSIFQGSLPEPIQMFMKTIQANLMLLSYLCFLLWVYYG